MLIRLLPLLLAALTVGCFVGASGEKEAPRSERYGGISSSAQAANGPAIIIPTVTPVTRQEASRLAVLPSPTETSAATETPTPEEEPTEVPTETVAAQAQLQAVETDTPLPTDTPTETPTPTGTATETATATRTPTPTPTETATPTPSPTQGITAGGFRADLLSGHNDVRSQYGLEDLRLNGTLNQIAQERAETMAQMEAKNLIDAGGQSAHYNPDGTNAFDMMNAQGYSYSDGAENIGYNYGFSPAGSVQHVMKQWIESPPHFANIRKATLNRVGFGKATSASGIVYYAAVFSD